MGLFGTRNNGVPLCGWILALLLSPSIGFSVVSASDYLIGLGSYDITGPAADVNMMGYANQDQIASGVHLRLRSRAFIVAEPQGKRLVFVNLDACMASQIVTIKVLERLKARYGEMYNEQNVAISGIHTHAGPGGYLQYVTYIITSFGFVRQSFDALVNGIEQTIIRAHENLRPGLIYVNQGSVLWRRTVFVRPKLCMIAIFIVHQMIVSLSVITRKALPCSQAELPTLAEM